MASAEIIVPMIRPRGSERGQFDRHKGNIQRVVNDLQALGDSVSLAETPRTSGIRSENLKVPCRGRTTDIYRVEVNH